MDIRLPVSYYSNFPIKCKCKNACFRYFITNNIAFAPLFSAFREQFRIVEFYPPTLPGPHPAPCPAAHL